MATVNAVIPDQLAPASHLGSEARYPQSSRRLPAPREPVRLTDFSNRFHCFNLGDDDTMFMFEEGGKL